MIGTTRSRVSFFMNRFRLGFIDYSDRIQVHKSLLNVVLHDQLPGDRPKKHSFRVPSKIGKIPAITMFCPIEI